MSKTAESHVYDRHSDIFSEKVQTSGVYVYEAKALAGSLESEPAWQAWRWDTTGPIIKKFADGNNLFDNVATDLTLLSYS